jgi:DDE superfamily endonuclease
MGLLFGAICPARSTGAAIIMPEVNVEAMNEHLAEISRHVAVGAIAVLVLDGAGWHTSPRLKLPDNIVLLPLPAYSPELNPVENIWEFLRANFLVTAFGTPTKRSSMRAKARETSSCKCPSALPPSPAATGQQRSSDRAIGISHQTVARERAGACNLF